MTDTDRAIIAAHKADPTLHTHTIAANIGCDRTTVARCRQKYGLTQRPVRIMRARVSPENLDWLYAEAEAIGVSLSIYLDGIVTDARLDAMDQQKVAAE